MLETQSPPAAPSHWLADLSAYAWRQQTIGESAAFVARLEAPGRPTRFLKAEAITPFAQLPEEIARLRWLESQDIPAARVVAITDTPTHHWLLMNAVPGIDMASQPPGSTDIVVAELAAALRRLHAVPVAACPFDQTLDVMLARAKGHMEAGLIDIDDFDDERLGQAPQALYAQLLADRLPETDLVVGHGDACLPNLLLETGRFSGFIDCSRLGVADRMADLAICARSVAFNLGEAAAAAFLAAYDIEPDPARFAYYRLLDEFL